MCLWCLFKKNNTDDKNTNNNPEVSSSEIVDVSKKNMKDLIVDDSDPNRVVIKKYLARFGREVDETTNGLEAIEKVTSNGTYNIIWMDLQMPKMNGVKCTQHLRTKLNYTGVIIGITGHVDQDSVDDCKNAGMNDIIPKPIDKKILEVYIEKYSKPAN